VNWAFGGTSPRNSVPFGDVVDTLNALGADFCILAGDWAEDINYTNTNANADSFTAIISRAEFDWLPVLGNHEAIPSDTLLQVSPYLTAMGRFPSQFEGNPYYKRDHKNIRFIALQNNVNYNVTSSGDYRVNNPTTYAAPTGGVTGSDYDGITVTASPQRVFLTNALATRDKAHWLLVSAHRPTYGLRAGDTSRLNFGRAAMGTGYINVIEDSLKSDERFLFLGGDKHQSLYLTHAIRDSAIVAATAKGGHHMGVASGSGSRTGDSTGVFAGAWLMDILARKDGADTQYHGHTSTAWHDTLTSADAGYAHAFTWALFTVYGDALMVEVFRTWTTASAGHGQYTGARNHKLITRRTLRRDL
jgi:hypothetical protein